MGLQAGPPHMTVPCRGHLMRGERELGLAQAPLTEVCALGRCCICLEGFALSGRPCLHVIQDGERSSRLCTNMVCSTRILNPREEWVAHSSVHLTNIY